MELKQLERFLTVVETGSLAEAARQLKLTQQGISASIQALETELSVRLLDRQPGGVTKLTTYGRALIPHAKAQIAADKRAKTTLLSIAEAYTGTVTIGVGETFAGDLIAEAISRLLTERPGLSFNIVEGYSERLIDRLNVGEFDFIAASHSYVSPPEGQVFYELYQTNDVISCSSSHPLTKKQSLQLDDLVGYPWLVPYSRPSDKDAIIETFAAAGLPAPTQFIGTDAYRIGTKLMLDHPFLMMTSPILLKTARSAEHFDVRILPINEPTVTRNASLIHPIDRPLTPAATLLFEEIVRMAGQSELLQTRIGHNDGPAP
jgi:DNA-binding transcriptional LysR family regulator